MTDDKGPNILSPEQLQRISWHAGEPGESGHFVEIGTLNDGTGRVAMRHSGDPDGTVIVYTPQEWEAFVAGVKDGEFDFDEG